jgi:uncharacterized protein YbgA (DUF1722 family)
MQMEKIDYETGATHVLNGDAWDTRLLELFTAEMEADGDAAKYVNRLARKYIRSPQERRDHIDHVLIHICGWGMDSLLKKLGAELREVA